MKHSDQMVEKLESTSTRKELAKIAGTSEEFDIVSEVFAIGGD